MKMRSLGLIFFTCFTLLGNKTNTNTKSYNPEKWLSTYSLNKMNENQLSTVASGLYYLLQDSPQAGEKTLLDYHTFAKGQHFDCYNAVVKAYEHAVFSYAVEKDLEKHEKDKKWKETLANFYESIMKNLEHKQAIVTFGENKGKPLPAPELFRLDTIENSSLCQPLKVVHRTVKKPLKSITTIQIDYCV